MFGKEHRMQAVGGIQTGVGRAKILQLCPTRMRDGRHDLPINPGANGTGQHGCSVNIESFRIYVAMAVDQHGFGWNRRVVISVQPATRPDRGTCPG